MTVGLAYCTVAYFLGAKKASFQRVCLVCKELHIALSVFAPLHAETPLLKVHVHIPVHLMMCCQHLQFQETCSDNTVALKEASWLVNEYALSYHS